MMATSKFKILFLGGAKRVSMARKFIEAGKRRNLDVEILSYELTDRVAIASVGEVIIGKRWSDPDIYADLHKQVQLHGIRAIIPFVDGAVRVAAEYREQYGDAFVPASSPELAEQMFDKVVAAEMFANLGLPIPTTARSLDSTTLPLIAKPRHGSASKGIEVIADMAAAERFTQEHNPTDYLLQSYVARREEYTVDCYATQSGEIKCISPRRRVEVTGGEVSQTVTVGDEQLFTISRQVIDRLGLRGAITIQFIHDLDTDRWMIMEINPRLGGGAVCSVAAGADLPGMIIDEALGSNVAESKAIVGVEITRYFEEVIFLPNVK